MVRSARISIYGRGETLLCQPFDVKKLQLTGEPFAIADQVWRMSQFAGSAFIVADTGVLMYRSPSSNTVQLAWYGRDGKRLQSLGEPGEYPQILLSPDEKRLAIERSDVRKGARNIWVLDLSTGIFSRLTFGNADNTDAMWSPDGHELIFTQNRNLKLDLYRTVVGRGGEELVYGSDEPTFAYHWWKDGRSILFTNSSGTTFYQLPLVGLAEARGVTDIGVQKRSSSRLVR
jgi:Tol biopolymer transport system component